MGKGITRAQRELRSNVLPIGAKFEAGDRTSKTIDHSNALPLFRKKPGSQQSTTADMFKPADPSTRPSGHVTKGKDLHTDPFAMDRKQYVPPTKVLRQPIIKEPHATGIAHIKPAERRVWKSEMITANGIVFRGGKVIGEKHHETTINNPQPRVNYRGMCRFKPKAYAASQRNTHHVTSPSAPAPPAKTYKHGIKRVAGHDEAASNSLVGVLRMEEKKPARSFDYRPPWGTCNTPRTPPTNRAAMATGLSPKPYAVEA